ncbi:hypothetical protein PG993_004728 [Apiospora rasikravindrae]|uniref:Uncharacterized protein n=1 Tax=Apiospora rasikravindrae TaxID=990691 RepID=A0ABR1TG38_9PEZI
MEQGGQTKAIWNLEEGSVPCVCGIGVMKRERERKKDQLVLAKNQKRLAMGEAGPRSGLGGVVAGKIPATMYISGRFGRPVLEFDFDLHFPIEHQKTTPILLLPDFLPLQPPQGHTSRKCNSNPI